MVERSIHFLWVLSVVQFLKSNVCSLWSLHFDSSWPLCSIWFWPTTSVPHDDVMKWKHFPRNWSFMRGIHRSPVNSPHKGRGPVNSPHKWPVTRSFDIFFDLHPNQRLSKKWWGWWFETLSRPLWRHRNAVSTNDIFHLYHRCRRIAVGANNSYCVYPARSNFCLIVFYHRWGPVAFTWGQPETQIISTEMCLEMTC